MKAAVGDRIVVKGHRVGEPDRDAKILEVQGHDGEPPYLVSGRTTGTSGSTSRARTRSSNTSRPTTADTQYACRCPDLRPFRGPAEVIETHISTVAFDGDVAHKRKKDVRFAFVDLSTPERREAICAREVELNRRFSPDVYLGVEDVVDDLGAVIDHAVRMRRMPAERRLSTLVRGKADVAKCVRQVARLVAVPRRVHHECGHCLGGDTRFVASPLGAELRGARAVRPGAARSRLARGGPAARDPISEWPDQAARQSHPKRLRVGRSRRPAGRRHLLPRRRSSGPRLPRVQ